MLCLVGCDPAAMVAFPVEKRRSNNERIMMVPGADGISGIAFVVSSLYGWIFAACVFLPLVSSMNLRMMLYHVGRII